jgi:hypothetical protein
LEQTSRIYERSLSQASLRQGEILSDVIQLPLDPDNIDFDAPTVVKIIHPFAIIVSQDCDLDWDFTARQTQEQQQAHKLLPNILFCMVSTAEELRGRADMNSGTWRGIRTNKNERYHFLQKVDPPDDALDKGLPELGIDFKRYFTIPSNEVHFQLENLTAKRRCRLLSPYLEHFSTRFSYFQSRIALPEDHFSDPVDPKR